MTSKLEKYNELIKSDVEKFIIKFNKITKNDPLIEELLHGWRILYSNIMDDCKVLLVGINPGKGEDIGTRNYEIEPLEKLEYVDDERNKYGLARSVNHIFNEANKIDLLSKYTMKTNVYYFATANSNNIYEFIDHLKINYKELFTEIEQKTIIWTKLLIEEIAQPKLIIAEGIIAYRYLYDEVFTGIPYQDLSKIGSIVPAWKKLNDNKIFIGFRRNGFGGINNLDDVISEISKYLYNL